MINLEYELQQFALCKESRKKILTGNTFAPPEFERIAKVVLAGHFLVSYKHGQTIVRPKCVEFYYHEEFEGGIKDPIVYHRNSKNPDKTKSIFPLGILHNHISGIDLTFEHGDNPQNAIRASMLIREFEINGRQDNRSTQLYEALYSQTSIFNGFSIRWIDGEKEAEVEANYRKNVAEYDAKGSKKLSTLNPTALTTSNKKYVQDQRQWQFRIKPHKREQITDL